MESTRVSRVPERNPTRVAIIAFAAIEAIGIAFLVLYLLNR